MTKEQVLEQIRAMADTIVEAVDAAGAEGVPSGHLYAACMSIMSLDVYTRMIDLLVQMERVTKRGHVLYPVKAK